MFDRKYAKCYTDDEMYGSLKERVYSVEYVNELIRLATEAGYLVSCNLPRWSMESEEWILAYEGYFSMEICNYASWADSHLEYNGQFYDKVLRAGKRVLGHAADDAHSAYPINHPKSKHFGAFTMILADELTYEEVIAAMKRGDMYASTGPCIYEVSLDGTKLHIECSPVKSIHVYFGSKRPRYEMAEPGQMLTSADIEIDEMAPYLRVSIFDEEGKSADTRGYFRDELGL